MLAKARNRRKDKKLDAGRRIVGKIAVVEIKERDSEQIKSIKIADSNVITLHLRSSWIKIEH